MGYAQRRAAIVGVYTTEQARFMDRTGISLQLESIKGALDDARLTPAAVDGLIPLDQSPYGRTSNAHMFWPEQLGEHPITFMDVGLASGGRRGPITVEDVVTSRMIADPLHLLDCAVDNDGGYAIVMAAEDIARDCRKPPVWVLGGAEAAYGGLLSNSHCTHPSGMHTIEVVRQLRGECGDRQVPDARIGVSLAQGMAVHGHAGTLIMARD
ncbi:MAG TPA: hypothetical protein VME19_11325 [Streptosporangiaceae bacterium]|nr:hypothetical protein [Streptosporangiaceae bacterium]